MKNVIYLVESINAFRIFQYMIQKLFIDTYYNYSIIEIYLY